MERGGSECVKKRAKGKRGRVNLKALGFQRQLEHICTARAERSGLPSVLLTVVVVAVDAIDHVVRRSYVVEYIVKIVSVTCPDAIMKTAR